MGSKGTQTTTQNSTTAPDPQAYAAYQSLLQRAGNVASTPYQAYTGELTAPVNAQENLGISGVNANAGYAQPYYNSAIQQAQTSSQPLTAANIQQYMSPYTQNVVDATQAQFNNQNQQAVQQVKGNAIAQGALGGNREAIAEGNTLSQLQNSQAPVIAGLYNQGYGQAVNTAQQQQALGLQGANAIGSLAGAGQNAGLAGATTQIGAGQLQQNTQNAQDQALLQQYMMAQAYPYQQAQWLAGMDTAVGSQMGGTSTGQTTAPAPSPLSSIFGGITSGVGLLGSLGVFSDKHVKENIKEIGRAHDGQRIVRFNYKGDPTTHIGFIAQDVERKHPHAVGEVNGIKTVDYKAATEDAVKHKAKGVVGYASGGGVATSPWGNAMSFIPTMNASHGSGAPHASAPGAASNQQSDMSKQVASIGDLTSKLSGALNPASYGGGNFMTDAYGGSSSNPLSGLSASDYGSGFARGGVAAFADGGHVDDWAERISQLVSNGRDRGHRAFYNDTRAGLLNSATAPNDGSTYGGIGQGLNARRSMQMLDAQDIADKVRGYADGGVPSFDDRFDPVDDAVNDGTFSSGPDTTPIVPKPVKTQGVVAAPTTGGSIVDPSQVPDPNSPDYPPLPSTASGIAAAPQSAPTAAPTRAASAIAGIESGAEKNPYTSLGPVTRTGDRAYGKYQVMGENIPEWTKEATGKAYTPEQFLSNPQLQDQVFNYKFGQYSNKYGPEGAARAWFAGEGGMNDPNRRDILGTSVADYSNKFQRAYGSDSDAGGQALAFSGNDSNAPDTSNLPSEVALGYSNTGARGVAPGVSVTSSDSDSTPSKFNWGADSRLWPALISAGFGMMASRSPSLGGAIGEGGLAGVSSYNAQQKADFEARKFAEQQQLQQSEQQLRENADRRAEQNQQRTNATASLIPDGKGGYKINPTYLDLKKQEADINTKDRWAPIGSVVSGGESHPLVMNSADGRILDAQTGKPPQQGDEIQTRIGGRGGADPGQVAKIAQGIRNGNQPPTLSGLYGMSGPVRAALEESGFDLNKAQLEYKSAEKQVASLNGPQMVRFVGLAKSVSSTIDEVRELSKELQNSGVPLLNAAKLATYMQTMGNTPQGQLAARYIGAVNTLKEEFANLANGGYAPTEAAWKLANDQINGNYGVKQLGASLDEVQRLIHYRVNAIPGLNTIGPGGANRYTGATGAPLMEDKGHGVTPPAGTPTRVRQNGHTYELQPDGKYKAID